MHPGPIGTYSCSDRSVEQRASEARATEFAPFVVSANAICRMFQLVECENNIIAFIECIQDRRHIDDKVKRICAEIREHPERVGLLRVCSRTMG